MHRAAFWLLPVVACLAEAWVVCQLAQVSALVSVSEQEVEVAEALYDLARMFTQPSTAVRKSKVEASMDTDLPKAVQSQVTNVPSASECSAFADASNGAVVVPSALTVAPVSVANACGSVRSSSLGSASAASPIQPPSPAAAPVAEGIVYFLGSMGHYGVLCLDSCLGVGCLLLQRALNFLVFVRTVGNN